MCDCNIVQDKSYDPFDGQGLDLVCTTHDWPFNISAEEIAAGADMRPKKCPCAETYAAFD